MKTVCNITTEKNEITTDYEVTIRLYKEEPGGSTELLSSEVLYADEVRFK